MKALVTVSLVISLLSGCTSYGELVTRCQNGDRSACADQINRDNAMSGASAYSAAFLSGQMQRPQQQQMRMPVTTTCTPNIFGGMDCTTM